MDRWQKQVQASLLKSEDEALAALRKSYEAALKDIRAEIKRLQEKPETQSVIYQVQWQRQLEAQVSGIIDRMQQGQYSTLQGYLDGCYTDAYVGAMYDIAKQGVPVTTPIPQDQVTRAVLTNSKLSAKLYESMGKYLAPLKKAVTQELTRGIASAMSYADIARNIDNRARIGYSNAARIARTEGHRIQNAAALDAQHAAKDAGAEVVKQWDATLDGRTRKDHRKLDGQIREVDEDFEVAGRKASAPGHFGRPEQDINCRCTVLQRAKWALDDEELETLKERARYYGLDKAKDFDDFKIKYLKASEEVDDTKRTPVDALRPKTLAGAKRGRPMDFEAADGRRANPSFDSDPLCRVNCQSCVVAYEARLRGFDVQALPKGEVGQRVARDTSLAWLDPETGEKPKYTIVEKSTPKGRANELRKLVDRDGGRYTLQFAWKGGRSGHIVSMDRLDDGTLRIYDPQIGREYIDRDVTDEAYKSKLEDTYYWILEVIGDEKDPRVRAAKRDIAKATTNAFEEYLRLLSSKHGVKVLKVDGLTINPGIASGIMKAVEE